MCEHSWRPECAAVSRWGETNLALCGEERGEPLGVVQRGVQHGARVEPVPVQVEAVQVAPIYIYILYRLHLNGEGEYVEWVCPRRVRLGLRSCAGPYGPEYAARCCALPRAPVRSPPSLP